MDAAMLLSTVSLLAASANIFLMVKVFSVLSSIADSPVAWTMLAFGMGMIVIHLSLNVFIWIEPLFQSVLMQYVSGFAGVLGFAGLFVGARELHEVICV